MQTWSDNPVHKEFCVRFFVDTNILIYLVDNTFQSVNDFIEILNESPFVELVSSDYVMFEFVGVRKREQYLRIAADRVSKLPSGKINFSSILKYKDGYGIPNIVFEDVVADIQKEVNAEVEKIATEFKINYQFSSLHKDLLSPTFDVCLTSKISNQDSLVLVSSVLPQIKTTHDNVVLLTNDSSFVSSYYDSKIKDVLATHSVSEPNIYSINKIHVKGDADINLHIANDKSQLKLKANKKILELIQKRLQPLYLGKTFTPDSPTFPTNIICFKLVENFTVRNNIYITIISKELDFIYTSKRKILSLHRNGTELAAGFISPVDEKINVAYKLVDVDDAGNEVAVSMDIINAIRTEGNLVFIHPDS